MKSLPVMVGLMLVCQTLYGQPYPEIIQGESCKQIDHYLASLTESKGFSGGLLIIKDGNMIFCKGYGWANREKKIPFKPSTPASIGSITKAFTAAAILKLNEQGKLGLEDSIKKFFPDIPADKSNITIHQLLTHSSGFHEFLKEDGGDYETIDTKEFLHRAFSEPLAFEPGTKAVYTNVGMSVLGIIIEQISGMDYEEFLQRELLLPIGASGIGYLVNRASSDSIAHGYIQGKDWGTIPQHIREKGLKPYWNLKANGGLEASLNDMYIWANALTDNRILQEASIKKMFHPHIQEEGYEGTSYFGYGCNISKSRRGTKLIDNGGSNGIYHARLIRLPEEGLIFYMVTNEKAIHANQVLPNVTQLYFKGVIEQDAITTIPSFQSLESEMIYDILYRNPTAELPEEIQRRNISVTDDRILGEVGERLIEQGKNNEAIKLYEYYTRSFPHIVVAWNNLGDLYLAQAQTQNALTCYKKALQVKPDNQRALEGIRKLNKKE